MTLVLHIAAASPSMNEWSNQRARFAYQKIRAKWARLIEWAWLEQKSAGGRGPVRWVRPPGCRVRVTVERFTRLENALDPDNMAGGLKPILDALRRLKLVDDDRHTAIDLVVKQPKNPYRSPKSWTQITLERLEAG